MALQRSGLLTSSQLFTLAGFALIVLAVVAFPMKIPIQAQPADVDYYGVGWLFAPIIGIWGLAGMVLGLVQSAKPVKRIESLLMPIVAVVCVGLAYGTYMVVLFGSGIILSAGRGEPFWWIYFALILAASAIVIGSTIAYVRSREKTAAALENKKVKATAFAAVLLVPLLYSAILLFYLRLF